MTDTKLIERLKAWMTNLVPMGSPEFARDWQAAVELIDECITALSAQPGPVGADGDPLGSALSTVSVSYNLSSTEKEGAIREKLIELGWTPPPPQTPKTVNEVYG